MAEPVGWAELQAQFIREHTVSGISAKAWCEQQGLNYQTARRHIRWRIAQTAQSDAQSAQSAQSKVRTIAHSEIDAQPAVNEAKTKEGEGREGKSSSSSHTSGGSGQNPNTNGRDSGGRFIEGNPGNPNPPNQWRPGDRPALTHGGYAQFLDAPELFDQAEALRLRDELIFTRARVIFVTKTLKVLQQDLATATEITDRIALYDKLLRTENALEWNIQRIESIERTLSGLRIEQVNGPRIEAEAKRIEASTRKLNVETSLLEKTGGSEDTPVSELITEIQGMETEGLMSNS